MKVQSTALDGVLIIDPVVFSDRRGSFWESYQAEKYKAAGMGVEFVQDNISTSTRGTLRGLHFQHPNDQVKLVQVIQGEVFDVAVDIRKGSPTFGQWIGVMLSGDNRRQYYIPQGFAHGFCVTSESAVFSYKCSDFYAPESEGGILWSDPDIGIKWPVSTPVLSEKDTAYACLKDVPENRLPRYSKS